MARAQHHDPGVIKTDKKIESESHPRFGSESAVFVCCVGGRKWRHLPQEAKVPPVHENEVAAAAFSLLLFLCFFSLLVHKTRRRRRRRPPRSPAFALCPPCTGIFVR